MNPYSPELNYFLAYQYCRSLGLQLASFETKEKADTMTQYLKNAGYVKYDFWTSGNKLGTDMFLWMSTGLPFNATFDYMLRRPGNRPADVPPGTEPQRVARESGDSGSADGCVAMVAPTLAWEAQDCTLVKDFICEQTRCYYYNYGSIPVSATQGNRRPYITTTSAPASDDQVDEHEEGNAGKNDEQNESSVDEKSTPEEEESSFEEKSPEDPVVSRLITTAVPAPEHLLDITSLFTDTPGPQARKDNVFEGLQTREVHRSSLRSASNMKAEHRESPDYFEVRGETEAPNNGLEDAHTVGPYDSVQDYYVNDQPEAGESSMMKDQDDDSSTILPEAEPAYRQSSRLFVDK
ncbi:hypothetical protein APICC_06952 [Apis cerana cerana]|uniref:C-type lectin domain-containing protein n=1 Tax=Apis cerana cerana TaxID=94128 RepID=A0A2A3EV63_APICC|nr:hypothetical protein APICC_06952 [Apis cerana cerana]